MKSGRVEEQEYLGKAEEAKLWRCEDVKRGKEVKNWHVNKNRVKENRVEEVKGLGVKEVKKWRAEENWAEENWVEER